MKEWNVYLLKCKDNTIYCGITNDLKRRLKEHNSGRGAKYTKGRRPVKLINYGKCKSRSQALKLELKIKKRKKEQKIAYLKELTSKTFKKTDLHL